jgi:tetratricopeptide (TPR) repeat protein
MKIKIKNLAYLLVAFIAIQVFVACEDILDQTNPNAMDTTNFWKTEEDLSAGLNATYRSLRFNGAYRRWLHFLYISRADEGYCTSPDPSLITYSNFLINDYTRDAVIFTWLDLYKGIFWANQVLDNAPKIEMDNEERNRIIGQALFIRGVGLFNIAGVYGRGGIPLSAEAEEDPKICEQPEIYEQAQKDFDEAARLLPVQWENAADEGRITKGAAVSMDVKASAQLKQWDRVRTKCEEIFGLNIYKLRDEYRDNFTEAYENNEEALFEVQFMSGPVNGVNQLSHERGKFFGLPVTDCSWDDATAGNIIKTDLEKERTKDGKVDPRLKQTLFYFDPSARNEQFYGKTWTQWGLNQSKVYWKKYTCWDTKTKESHDDNGINLRIVRLADIYLMYAEALNELDRTAEAYEWINKVRERPSVNLPKLENSAVFTGIGNDKEKMRSQIMHERVCELSSEGWRWLDLERWGMFDTLENISWLQSRDSEFSDFVIGKNNRFPIPLRDIYLIPGLEQNPGYK